MADTVTEQVVREAPQLEAYRLGLLDLAKQRAEVPVNIPNIQVAGLNADQQAAIALGKQGIGDYQTYLNNSGGYLNQAATGLASVPGVAQGYIDPALANSQATGQQGVNTANQAAGAALGIAGQTAGQAAGVAGQTIGQANGIAGLAGAKAEGLANQSAGLANNIAGETAGIASGLAGQSANTANYLSGAGIGSLGGYINPALAGAQSQAVNGVNNSAGLGSLASSYAASGGNAANMAQGAAGLGTGLGIAGAGAYDPNRVGAFMDPYQSLVTQRALDEINRQGAMASNNLNAQSVKAGAFGGSRQGVEQTELGRNLQDVRANRILQDYSNNFNQAQNASINTFQNDQSRLQNAGNLALQGGQLASGTALGAAQLGANTNSGLASLAAANGFNLANLTQSGGLQAGQLTNNAFANAANTSLQGGQLQTNAALQGGQLGANTALQGGQMGMNAAIQGGQLGANTALQGGQLGANTLLQGGQLGTNAALQGGQLATNANMGLASLIGSTGLQAGQLAAGSTLDANKGIGSLALPSAQIGGLDQAYGQADSSYLYNLGANQQKQTQAELDAARNTTLAQEYEPFQRIAFASDIYAKTPSSQQTLTTASAPQASPLSQIIGAGIAGYGAINSFNQATKSNTFGQ